MQEETAFSWLSRFFRGVNAPNTLNDFVFRHHKACLMDHFSLGPLGISSVRFLDKPSETSRSPLAVRFCDIFILAGIGACVGLYFTVQFTCMRRISNVHMARPISRAFFFFAMMNIFGLGFHSMFKIVCVSGPCVKKIFLPKLVPYLYALDHGCLAGSDPHRAEQHSRRVWMRRLPRKWFAPWSPQK